MGFWHFVERASLILLVFICIGGFLCVLKHIFYAIEQFRDTGPGELDYDPDYDPDLDDWEP